ncbi:hypothetical protein BB559_003201 [Furculomyces boomerangus]|uniref:sulfate adenylyltransferase n=2 Tax=Harpellales TaxID=61421 RepID=A0A2T9YMX3_9FUNG|nr:hypothetical protein BB559_003201 [Furculomyces boomerangus]PVZ99029.1 hypothetical protein BB558_004963 [Smittium angustum]
MTIIQSNSLSSNLTPYGGDLKDLLARDAIIKQQLATEAKQLPYIVLSDRQLCDIEMIINGGFSPLEGFMTQEEYNGVVENMRLPNGSLWPIPIYLDIDDSSVTSPNDPSEHTPVSGVLPGTRIALLDKNSPDSSKAVAIITVEDTYSTDFTNEALKVYGSDDDLHPAVFYLFNSTKKTNVGGKIQAIKNVYHDDFTSLRKTPAETRQFFASKDWERIVAFQTRNPMHRAHLELTMRAAKKTDSRVFIHPVVGLTKPGDIDYVTRVKVYQILIKHFPENTAYLSLLPLAMRMGGPKEAVLHAIIRRNYGATLFIVGRDHAGPGKDKAGNLFYGPYEAQEVTLKHQEELGIEIVPFSNLSYIPEIDAYEEVDKIPVGTKTLDISGTELRNRLKTGEDIPNWFSFTDVVQVLRDAYAN